MYGTSKCVVNLNAEEGEVKHKREREIYGKKFILLFLCPFRCAHSC